jgi:hypothetical protein
VNANNIGIFMIIKLLRRIPHLLTYLTGGGSWGLYPYESKIIEAVIDYLDNDIRQSVEAQLKQNFFLERIGGGGRINVFRFYDFNKALKIPYPEFSDLLLNVEVMIEGKKHITHVTFYKGYLFSIEFKKPGKFYLGKEIKIGKVGLGKPKQSYTSAIDRLEHGKETDYNP